MHDALFAGVVVGFAVIFILDFLCCTIRSGGNGRLALVSAEYLNTAMIYCDRQTLLSAVVITVRLLYNKRGNLYFTDGRRFQ